MRPFPWQHDEADFTTRYPLVRRHRPLFDAVAHACASWHSGVHPNAWASRDLVELYAAFLKREDEFPEPEEMHERLRAVYNAFVAAAEAVEGALLDAEELARKAKETCR